MTFVYVLSKLEHTSFWEWGGGIGLCIFVLLLRTSLFFLLVLLLPSIVSEQDMGVMAGTAGSYQDGCQLYP